MNKRLRIVLSAFVILLLSAATTIASSAFIVSKEAPFHETCLIEDCAVTKQQAGFPFPTREITKLVGMNCGNNSDKAGCSESQFKGLLWLVLDFAFYVTIFIVIIALLNRRTKLIK